MEADPDLYQALMRGWDIAWDEWLPALGMNEDSFNSYPHLRNLENYADAVIKGFEESPGIRTRVELRPVEIYLLLSAILFHDIGKILEKEEKNSENPQNERTTHATISQDIILENPAALGIPSIELARSLGRICSYHDPPRDKEDDLYSKLRDAVIDPYGVVRERALASLLVLFDHLDSAFTRVVPRYLKIDEEKEVIGAFRSVIRGVFVDYHTRMVRTVLSEKDICKEKVKPKKSNQEFISYKFNDRWLKEWNTLTKRKIREHIFKENYNRNEIKSKLSKYGIPVGNNGIPKLLTMLIPDRMLRKYGQNISIEDFPLIYKVTNTTFEPVEWLIARQLINAEKVSAGYWPSATILAVTMGNVRENASALLRVQQDLAAMGIPILAWVIEYRERLYNEFGQETYEPIFHAAYLVAVAESMWNLSTQIFGSTAFSYENLASRMREPDIERIRLAVRRIGIITEHLSPRRAGNDTETSRTEDSPIETGMGKDGAIWYGTDSWKWKVRLEDKQCVCVDLSQVKNEIERLGEPCVRDY